MLKTGDASKLQIAGTDPSSTSACHSRTSAAGTYHPNTSSLAKKHALEKGSFGKHQFLNHLCSVLRINLCINYIISYVRNERKPLDVWKSSNSYKTDDVPIVDLQLNYILLNVEHILSSDMKNCPS
ncbi:hypothetical protein WA026_016370 [Henosepilachna vigintioctopunctata]|uniref:Uncharacterized protein n=1 Tax=Henosepilachna vigintioctopunctata TaxID=420089 RepID=A0AAW1UL51_9CUCU